MDDSEVRVVVVENPQVRVSEESIEITGGEEEEKRALRDAFEIRREVFIDEQEVPEELEWDEHDENATHFVVYSSNGSTNKPVGTARLRNYEGPGKIERVAVPESARNQGWGKRVMEAAEDYASSRGYEKIILHAQTQVEDFYRKIGYETTSDEVFEEDGILHVKMEKSLEEGR